MNKRQRKKRYGLFFGMKVFNANFPFKSPVNDGIYILKGYAVKVINSKVVRSLKTGASDGFGMVELKKEIIHEQTTKEKKR